MYFIPDVGKIFTHKSAESGAFWWRGFVVVMVGGGGEGVDIYPLSANAEILSGRCILKCISTMSRDLRREKHIRSKDAMMDARHFITSGNNSL